MSPADRRARLARAHLYFVSDASPPAGALEDVVRGALAGGTAIYQLRDKRADDDALLAHAAVARRVCDEAGALFILNDRPDLAVRAQADGVHVGQDDMDVADVRAIVGDDMLVGLSTHSPVQIDDALAADVDYIGVGPVHATPTKQWRPAVGLGLVEYAAAHVTLPWFAIGGISLLTIAPVVVAGATRAAVVREIAEALDPAAAAARMCAALAAGVPEEAHGPAQS